MALIPFRVAYERLQQAYNQRYQIAADALQRRQLDVTNMLRGQLYEGIKGDGRKIGEYRSPTYAEFKHDLNTLPGAGNVDLFVTGQYYRGFGLEVGGNTYQFVNNDPKASKLEARFGQDINRLAPDTRVRVWREILRREMVEGISRITGFRIV